ncbi:MAG: lipid-A-disaccharide synthase [Deltaproteobacteria bacterium]|nr:lipid-A-disaccharide synthase [Deltaproteobacteria bacterium]MBW1962735.1 lipid-A-disaccharide synthase [Deltaproteobacteria bacterium]MBW2150841.1 lipid-A-disaccharide synthase [Deltaproteobacteria bacterium]
MIIAGDTSGDLHGAKLVRNMRKKNNSLFFCGIGGHELRDAGVRLLLDTSSLSVVGVTEIFSKLPHFLRGILSAGCLLKILHPDLLILVDFPGFNLPFSAIAKRYNMQILYYIGPQVWAWRKSRVKKIRRRIDHMAVILPFEEDFYKHHRVPATFVGHPLLDDHPIPAQAPAAISDIDTPIIGLLPGSRDREIARHLPVMLQTAEILTERMNTVRFIISRAPSVNPRAFEQIIKRHIRCAEFRIETDGVHKIFRQSVLCVVASGTATLQAALYGIPMVIMYKVSCLSYWVGKALVRGVDYIGLANLIAGRGIVPELIQNEATPENISETVLKMLNDGELLEAIRRDLIDLHHKLGGAGASERAADIALSMIGSGNEAEAQPMGQRI